MPNNGIKYKDFTLSIEERVEDLLSRMTIGEKISQLVHESKEIPRLDVPAYNWWGEALHGVSRAGIATVFPQAIGLAATFNTELIYKTACIISEEARAKYHEAIRHEDRGIFKGITLWNPNVNIFRDPRWGRGHETFGEDPYLTSRLGVAMVKGMQGDDEKYLKTVSTPKHAFAHSGPEGDRESFDAKVSKKDLMETYVPAFKACVEEGKAASIMTSYNRINGEACSASTTIMKELLREKIGFEGYVVCDCGAICNLHKHHKVTNNPVESAALAINSGVDLNCGDGFNYLGAAVASGMVSEETIDQALRRLLAIRFKLGMFDPDEMVSYAQIPYDINDCKEHRAFSKEVSKQSFVLLKNEENLLPLSKELKTIAVIGPNADNKEVLLGNYHGTPSQFTTILQGIRNKVEDNTKVYYAKGCEHEKGTEALGDMFAGFSEAVSMAERADITVLCLGLTPLMEGEKGDAFNSDASGDKRDLELPSVQQKLLERICALGKKVICVVISGSALSINWMEDNAPVIIQGFYPGQEGGNALADLIFGADNFSGKLPITFYKTTEELPPFESYSMEGRTYRYMTNQALYPFGFGLSYTKFSYSNLYLSKTELKISENVEVCVEVQNIGVHRGMEVVQLYLSDVEASIPVPKHQLIGFNKIDLDRGEKTIVTFTITPRQMALIDLEGECVLEPGSFQVFVGGTQPNCEINEKYQLPILNQTFVVSGDRTVIAY